MCLSNSRQFSAIFGNFRQATYIRLQSQYDLRPDCDHCDLPVWQMMGFEPVGLKAGHDKPITLKFIILYPNNISKIISERVLTCDSGKLNSAAQLGDEATDTMTQYPTESHYHHTLLTSHCPIILIPSAKLTYAATSISF